VSGATLVNLEGLWAEINQNRKLIQVFANIGGVNLKSAAEKQQKMRESLSAS
jgi:hypothetical protein